MLKISTRIQRTCIFISRATSNCKSKSNVRQTSTRFASLAHLSSSALKVTCRLSRTWERSWIIVSLTHLLSSSIRKSLQLLSIRRRDGHSPRCHWSTRKTSQRGYLRISNQSMSVDLSSPSFWLVASTWGNARFPTLHPCIKKVNLRKCSRCTYRVNSLVSVVIWWLSSQMPPVNSLNKIIKISNLRVVSNNKYNILLRLNSNRLKKM